MVFDGTGWKTLTSQSPFEAMDHDTATQTTTNFGLAVDVYDTDAIVAHTSGVYFYKFNGAQWVQTQYEPITYFGSVSIYDGFAFVGRPGARSVQVYEYNADPRELRWVCFQDIPGDAGTTFGYSVAINDAWGIVGCTTCSTTSSIFFAYRKSVGSGHTNSPTQTRWIEVPTPYMGANSGNQCGNAVDIDGDQCLVGCYLANLGGKDLFVDAGVAHIFRYNGTAWALEQRLAATDTAAYARFGSSVSFYGNYAAVGA